MESSEDLRPFEQIVPDQPIARWVPSTCGLCSIGCGVDIAVSGEKIVGVRGRPAHPVSNGRLGPKGLNQFYANHHPRRARVPLIRQRDGDLRQASWDEAMDLLVDRFNQALATDGPDAVAFYNSGQLLLEEYYTLAKIARGGLGTANIDANTRLCTATTGASLMENFGADGPPGSFADLDEAECIVLVGHNAAEQSTVLWMRILQAKARANPPKIIVIDPRKTLTVATGADLHLRLKPGTNLALLNGICHLLIENGWIDPAFIEHHTARFEEVRDVVSRYPPEVVEGLCAVPAEALRQAAEWIGTSRSTVTTCLQGVYQSHQATASACAINNMHLLMGKIGRPGCAPFQFAGQPSSMNTRETGADGTYPGYRNWEDPNHMRDLAMRWNIAPELLGKKPVSTPEIFGLCEKGLVKVLWVVGTNPAVSMTDRTTQLRTLSRVFLVVQDGFVDTETAQFADIILPAAIWGEKTGCMTNAERRCSLLRKAVEPPGQALPDLDIFIDFARRMNLRDLDGQPLVQYNDPEGAFNEWREISRDCIPDYSGMSYTRLAETGGLQWPCTEDHPGGTVRLYEDLTFPTDWKTAEVFETDLETGREHTMQEYREKRDPKGRAFFVPAHYEPPLEEVDREFPLVATTGRQAYHWHTRTKTGRAPALDDAAPEPFVSISNEDAARYGIDDGRPVKVTSRRGSVIVPSKVGDVMPPGVLFLPFHYGELGGESGVNDLMPNQWDPASKQPVQKMAAVRVEPLSARRQA